MMPCGHVPTIVLTITPNHPSHHYCGAPSGLPQLETCAEVLFVNAWYGLGQVLISNYEYHNCYSNQVVQKGFLELTKCAHHSKA